MSAPSKPSSRVVVPVLERHCGSWVIVDLKTGRPAFETFDRATAADLDGERYEVLTALQWLSRFARAVASSSERAA